jgi:predicted Rossmann-fold nucleotide-binding protein
MFDTELLANAQRIACVGTSGTTAEQRDLCIFVGFALAKLGKHVVSGNAVGADFAYATGVNYHRPELLILYIPTHHHNIHHWCFGNQIITDIEDEWKAVARRNHPVYDKLSANVKALMNRNAGIIMNSDFVIALPDWKKKGGGGTGHDIRIAVDLGKPYIDISKPDVAEYLVNYFKSLPAIKGDLLDERKRKS